MKVAVAGLGLIGGSFFKAAKKAGHDVAGLHHGDCGEKLSDAELVMVCMPPEAIVPWIAAHRNDFRKGAVVVDICGTKRNIMRAISKVEKNGWTFIGGHPMAGREVSGYENSLAGLFKGASMILVPEKNGAPKEVLAKLEAFFKSVGFARVVVADAKTHDSMIAFTSQLCHVIATSYSRDPKVARSLGFSAGSYDDMTRIATQNEDDRSRLYLGNKDSLVKVLDSFIARMGEMRGAIASGDEKKLKRMIREGTKAKKIELARRSAQ